jgi:hypothetical protein
MNTTATPNPWQAALGQRLAQALEQSRLAHAPLSDAGHDATATRWRLAPRPASRATAAAALSEMLGMGTPATQGDLMKHCLQHYRSRLAGASAEDDLGRALAAYLGACRQAADHEPLSTERWQAVTQWLEAWVVDELPWDRAPGRLRALRRAGRRVGRMDRAGQPAGRCAAGVGHLDGPQQPARPAGPGPGHAVQRAARAGRANCGRP